MNPAVRDNGAVWTVEGSQRVPSSAADFEKAVAATGYGLFNVLLLLAALPIAWACVIDTTSTAFIINSSECVFELTMLRRGVAVAAVYLGMIVAGPLWDLLLQDWITGSAGKRNVLIVGSLLDAACNLLRVHADSFDCYVLLKFISGTLVAGPLTVVMPYLAEFHSAVYQPAFSKWAGLLVAVSNIIPAALAATLMLLRNWFHFTIYNYFYPTWRVYLLICAIPSVLGFWLACLLPQSPKFLMAQGKNQEALRLLRAMYSINNFKSSSHYPIKELVSQTTKSQSSSIYKHNLTQKLSSMKLLISSPYLKNFSMILILQFCSMVGFNVMRLWVPPVFVILNNFRVLLRSYYPEGEYITMCEMIFPRIDRIDHSSCNYTLPNVESAVYVNSTIIATSAVSFGFLFSFLTTTRIRKTIVMIFQFLLTAVGYFSSNWVIEIPYMLTLLSFIIVGSRIAGNTVLAYNAEVTPQLLRPMAVNMINFIGNVGAAGGNIIFALILDMDCLTAFLGFGCVALVGTIVPLFLTKKQSEKVKAEIAKY